MTRRVERCAYADAHVRCARAAVRGRFCGTGFSTVPQVLIRYSGRDRG